MVSPDLDRTICAEYSTDGSDNICHTLNTPAVSVLVHSSTEGMHRAESVTELPEALVHSVTMTDL